MDAYRGQALNRRVQIVADSEKAVWLFLQRQQASPQNTELIISAGMAKVTSAVKELDERAEQPLKARKVQPKKLLSRAEQIPTGKEQDDCLQPDHSVAMERGIGVHLNIFTSMFSKQNVFSSICTVTGQQRIMHTCWLFWRAKKGGDETSVSLSLNGTLDPRRVQWHIIEQFWPFSCALITFMSGGRQRPQNNPPPFMN